MHTITLTNAQLETLGSVLTAGWKIADDKATAAHKAGKPITAEEQRTRRARINEILKMIDSQSALRLNRGPHSPAAFHRSVNLRPPTHTNPTGRPMTRALLELAAITAFVAAFCGGCALIAA